MGYEAILSGENPDEDKAEKEKVNTFPPSPFIDGKYHPPA
jgi:hypothetical protein